MLLADLRVDVNVFNKVDKIYACEYSTDVYYAATIQNEQTPLHCACDKGHSAIVKLLLADPRGVDVTVFNKVVLLL